MSTYGVKVGMFGGSNGDVYDIAELTSSAPSSLRSLEIWSTSGHEGIINAISFTFVDSKNHMNKAGPWGTPLPGQKSKTIHLTNVRITELSGYTYDGYITSLTFRTTDAQKHHGPFGKVRPKAGVDTHFRIPLMNGSIVAFCAQADDYLSAIGAYLKI
ncbi:hypothetical protein CFC21_014770 [Triticum aestivum]|uniref:Jacalin-type lectin domain-containing protein n=2 Tax=Triticum aestivum TaxID=4565 RepID=A0A9R1IZU8_WHEAT|nr:protein GOS9-like [Triticum aestivum]KAF6998674.1 hypothetical protein CFC21_014770 [Triticum aestivum]